eukprot:EW704424.1.p3 GENE.EW704424.1~~EW704424.1.p3  ORF type:complete len:86 (+),score=10.16 EW704424.1:163-420(+)
MSFRSAPLRFVPFCALQPVVLVCRAALDAGRSPVRVSVSVSPPAHRPSALRFARHRSAHFFVRSAHRPPSATRTSRSVLHPRACH